MPESGSEPGIVALQDVVHNASPSDTVLESSPNGDIQSNGAADRERSEKQKEWYVRGKCCRRQVEISDEHQTRAASVARDARMRDEHVM